MCTRMGHLAVLALMFITAALSMQSVAAQNAGSDTVSREEFERRLQELNKKYENDLAARDRAIADLRAELAKRPPSSDQLIEQEHDKAHAQAVQDLMKQIDSGQGVPATQRTAVSFNPDFAVVT